MARTLFSISQPRRAAALFAALGIIFSVQFTTTALANDGECQVYCQTASGCVKYNVQNLGFSTKAVCAAASANQACNSGDYRGYLWVGKGFQDSGGNAPSCMPGPSGQSLAYLMLALIATGGLMIRRTRVGSRA